MQRLHIDGRRSRFRLRPEHPGSPLQELSLPGRDLVGMNVKLLGQFGQRLLAPYQPVDEVLVQSERRSKRIFTTIRAGMALWATRTMMRASYAPLLVGSRTRKHQPRATASFGVPAPNSRRISSPRLCPATWIR